MRILKILTDDSIEVIETADLFGYACSLFGSTHIDVKSKVVYGYALIYDDAEKDETINKIASKLFDNTESSMKGICLLIKISDGYFCHDCYEEGIIDINENDKKQIEEIINET